MLIEPYIHDTAADRNDRAQGWGLQAFLSGHIQPFRNGKIRRTNSSTLASMMTRRERLRDKQLVSADRSIGHCNSNQGRTADRLKKNPRSERREVVDIAQWIGQPAR